MSQRAEILAWLKRKPITALDALQHIGCFRLAARIEELRRDGWEIETVREEHDGGWHARYVLKRIRP